MCEYNVNTYHQVTDYERACTLLFAGLDLITEEIVIKIIKSSKFKK